MKLKCLKNYLFCFIFLWPMTKNYFLLFDCVLINFLFEHMDSFWLCFCYGDFCIFELVLLFSLNSLCVQFGLISLKEMFYLCSCTVFLYFRACCVCIVSMLWLINFEIFWVFVWIWICWVCIFVLNFLIYLKLKF